MKQFTLLIYGFLISNVALAVNLQIIPSPTEKAQCPGVAIQYTVVKEGGGQLPSCIYTWTVVNGTIEGVNGQQSVSIKWNDKSGTGTLKVTTSGCTSETENGSTKTNTYTIHSVFGRTFTNNHCPSSRQIPICNPTPIQLCVDAMYLANTGGADQPPLKEVDRYIYHIPAGWRVNSTTNGPTQFSTSQRSIILEPLQTTITGTSISVYGSVSNSCGAATLSVPTVVTITRTPDVTLDPPVGFAGVTCGSRSPITFQVTSLPCATSHQWTLPPGGAWTGQSTTRTITITPPANLNSNSVLSVRINLPGGAYIDRSYTIKYLHQVPAPTPVSNGGIYEWCNYESFTFTANPPPGYGTTFGYEWYATNTNGSNGLLINGATATKTTPAHTWHNYTTVQVQGSAYGSQGIGVRLNNQSHCPPSPWVGFTKRVGPYSNSEFSIIGPSNICPNQSADFRPNFITSDITGYQWTAPSDWSSSGASTPYFHVSVPAQFYGGAVTLRLQNRCGWTNTPYVLGVYPGYGCGYTYSLSPNPSSTTLTVGELDEENGSTITIKDKTSKTVREVSTKKSSVEIDVSDLKSDTYVLIVKHKGTTESQHIVINH